MKSIGQLIQNAQLIRTILEELGGKLPEVIEDALTPAAFIESHRAQFNKAQKQLADRHGKKKLSNRGTTSKL